jgi:hypothetical protein
MQLVSATQPDWTERRQAIANWIQFVGDFGQIDVDALLPCIEDNAFVEAVEAVLKAAGRPWASFEHVRDFCVQRLYGEKSIAHTGPPRPRHRVTPFSVPMELLRSVFTFKDHRGRDQSEFVPGRLRIREESFVLDVPMNGEADHRFLVTQDQMLLLTTVWARVVPPIEPLRHRVEIIDEGANRRQDMLLWALVTEPQPLFLPLSPNTSVNVRVRPGWAPQSNENTPPIHVLMSFEGWSYLGGW